MLHLRAGTDPASKVGVGRFQ